MAGDARDASTGVDDDDRGTRPRSTTSATVRKCEICPRARSKKPKKIVRKCYDALDADEMIGPILLDDRDTTPRYAHQACALWCPEIYFDARSEKLKRCAEAFKRAKQIACAWCKERGAAIGCGVEECPRSYHLTCAHEAGCAFSQSDFTLACPRHVGRLARERSEARWQDIGVEDVIADVGAANVPHLGSAVDRDVAGVDRRGDGAMTAAAAAAATLAGSGATPILSRIRAAAARVNMNKKRKRRGGGGGFKPPLIDDKFMSTKEGAIYRAVIEAGARLNAETDERVGIDDDEEAFKLRESRRLEKDKCEIPRIVVGGGLGSLTYNQGWDSLAGLEEHVKTLKELALLPLAYPEMFASLGVSAARGVLLHGPPGTGKTAAVRALLGAAAQGPRPISFFSRLGADCLGKYSGEAERKLRLLFEEAERHQPSIIFFDEIDGLAPARKGGGASGSGAQDEIHSSVVATLLALMDGLSSRGSVVVVASTNRPDAVDAALRRPGRFDRELFFGLPDATARADILAVHTRAWTPRPSRKTLDAVAARTEGAAGADLRAIANAALMSAVKRACPSLLAGDPTRDSLSVELEARLPPPASARDLLDEARVSAALGHIGAGISLREFDALGVRMSVYWPLENEHHEGTIVGYDRTRLCHRVKYDDSTILNAEETWMQLFRPNISVRIISSDLDIDAPMQDGLLARAREAMKHAVELREKYLKAHQDGVYVEPRDWSLALTTSSGACSARSAAAALVPRGSRLPSYLVPVVSHSLTRALSEFAKRGAPLTPKCIQAIQSLDVMNDDNEHVLAAAGAIDGSTNDNVSARTTPWMSLSGHLENPRTGCRVLIAGDVGNGQRQIMDAVLSTMSGASLHLINLSTLLSSGDGDAVRGVSAALVEPLRQAARTPTTLIMPDMDLWALGQNQMDDGSITEITTTALWDLVQSTVSESLVASVGDGGLYVMATVNVPSDSLPTSLKHFFQSSGVFFDVAPILKSESAMKASIDRAACDIVDSDVIPTFEESHHHFAAIANAPTLSGMSVKDDETKLDHVSHELACEALRIRVRRSRSIVRHAIARCTVELMNTGRFYRFFENSAEASRLIKLAKECKIGDPHRYVKDLRACAKAIKPRRNTKTNLHGPLVSLGFQAVDTLESWLHLGVIKLYDEYAKQDKDYDVAIGARAMFSLPGAKSVTVDNTEKSEITSGPTSFMKMPPRRNRADIVAHTHKLLHDRLQAADISCVDDLIRVVDDVRVAERVVERARFHDLIGR